jgi:hypothetical protein
MPCESGPGPRDWDEQSAHLRSVTALLCALCAYVEPMHTPDLWPDEVRIWWAQHKARDARRRANESKNREAHRARLRQMRAEIDKELGES